MLYRVICGCLSAAISANYPLQHPHIRRSAFYPRPRIYTFDVNRKIVKSYPQLAYQQVWITVYIRISSTTTTITVYDVRNIKNTLNANNYLLIVYTGSFYYNVSSIVYINCGHLFRKNPINILRFC